MKLFVIRYGPPITDKTVKDPIFEKVMKQINYNLIEKRPKDNDIFLLCNGFVPINVDNIIQRYKCSISQFIPNLDTYSLQMDYNVQRCNSDSYSDTLLSYAIDHNKNIFWESSISLSESMINYMKNNGYKVVLYYSIKPDSILKKTKETNLYSLENIINGFSNNGPDEIIIYDNKKLVYIL